jgi:hypothetical protein
MNKMKLIMLIIALSSIITLGRLKRKRTKEIVVCFWLEGSTTDNGLGTFCFPDLTKLKINEIFENYFYLSGVDAGFNFMDFSTIYVNIEDGENGQEKYIVFIFELNNSGKAKLVSIGKGDLASFNLKIPLSYPNVLLMLEFAIYWNVSNIRFVRDHPNQIPKIEQVNIFIPGVLNKAINIILDTIGFNPSRTGSKINLIKAIDDYNYYSGNHYFSKKQNDRRMDKLGEIDRLIRKSKRYPKLNDGQLTINN